MRPASAITRRSTERSQRARVGETSSLNIPDEIGKLTAKNCSRRSTGCRRCCRTLRQDKPNKRELRSPLVDINAIQAELDASLLAIKAAKFTELATLEIGR